MTASGATAAGGHPGGSRPTGWARRTVFAHLARLTHGSITVVEQDEVRRFGRPDGLRATVTVHDRGFYADLALGGSIGAAEAYMAGRWDADDLTALLRVMARNRAALGRLEGGWARWTRPLHRLRHLARRNTRAGSRRNIAAHYDLGNEFFALWLDASLTYSCNVFESDDATLEEAAAAKYDRICRKLGLGPRHRVLEIGCGWGGFALHAAGRYGCRVTATTISHRQLEWARQRVDAAGLSDRVELLLEDYRDLRGTYDRLVSIEAIEAVGHDFLDAFLRTCSDRLAPDGLMALQAITMTDQLYAPHTRSVDFIKRFIFPGSFIPSIAAIADSVARVTDLKLYSLEDITHHYARTLRCWRQRFHANLDRVRGLGYPDLFVRMWTYYLCYCEAGFEERYIGDVQVVLAKPDWRPA